ncbi:MAG: hypothetical protein WBE58_21375 [Verrucomicrobiales bacterium]
MEKPFRFRYVNEIAGTFVLIAVTLMLVGVLISGRIQGWFLPARIYRAVLPDQGTMGIKPGSEVRILGSRAGQVDRIELRHQANQEPLDDTVDTAPDHVEQVAVMAVKGDDLVFIGKESKAVLRFDLGGFGAPYIEISRGTTPRDKDDVEMVMELEADVKDGLTKSVDSIRDALLPAINQIEVTTATIGKVADTLADPKGDFQHSLLAMNEILSRTNAGQGAAGVVLSDAEAGEQMKKTIANLTTASADLGESIKTINKIVEGLDKGEGAAGALLSDKEVAKQLQETIANFEKSTAEMNKVLTAFTPVVNNTNEGVLAFGKAAVIMQEALMEYDVLAEALQRHWLVHRNVIKVEEEMAASSTASGIKAVPNASFAAPAGKPSATPSAKPAAKPAAKPKGLWKPFH